MVDYLITLSKINVEKCFKYRNYNKTIYFIVRSNLVKNEIFVSEGKNSKFISTVDINSIDNINEKLVTLKYDLEKKLSNVNCKTSSFQFWPASEYDDFMSFYKVITESLSDYCTDVAISDKLKRLNKNMPELGLRVQTEENGNTNNFYLFIIPNVIFTFKKAINQSPSSFCERVIEKINTFNPKLPQKIIRYYTNYFKHIEFIQTLKQQLLKCLFTNEPTIKKNIIYQALNEASIKILPFLEKEDGFGLVLEGSEYQNFIKILSSIILNEFDAVMNVIQKNIKNVECIIVLESEFNYLIGEYDEIEKIVKNHFMNTSD